jgi:hypothetical protein
LKAYIKIILIKQSEEINIMTKQERRWDLYRKSIPTKGIEKAFMEYAMDRIHNHKGDSSELAVKLLRACIRGVPPCAGTKRREVFEATNTYVMMRCDGYPVFLEIRGLYLYVDTGLYQYMFDMSYCY